MGYLWYWDFYPNNSFQSVFIASDYIQLTVNLTGAISVAASDFIPVTPGKSYSMNFASQLLSGNGDPTKACYEYYNTSKVRTSA